MAGERVVRVSLTAQVSNYVAGMEQARKKTQETAKSSEDLQAKFEAQNKAMTQVGVGLTAIGTLAAVGVGLAIKKFADFDQAMSNVKAATHESASNMELLRNAALDAGARTVFSATEAANAVEELGKAGLSTSDILNGGLDGALDLAAAGGLGVADAAGIAAVALKTFKLEGSDMAHVADLLAAGAGKAMGDVTDLSGALAQSGQVASSTGLSIEETTATLSAFAAQGLLGSDAGTSFKSMLQRLTPQSAEAAAKMDELGISAYDAQGNFVGMEKFAGILQTGLKDLTTEQRNSALATIFGSDAVRAATVLYTEGADGIGEWEKKVNDSGYAAETAAARLDNLKGDVEQLGGAFDTALIKAGSAADGSLRFLVQTATDLVDIFNAAPVPVQQAALALGAVTAAATLAGGAFLLGVPKIAEFSTALATLSASEIPAVAGAAVKAQGAIAGMTSGIGKAAAFMKGPWGLALAAAAVGVALLTKYLDSLQASSEEIANSLATATSAAQVFETVGKGKDAKWLNDIRGQLDDLPAVLQASADQSENLFARFDATHFGAFDALREVGDELGKVASSDLPAAQKSFRLLTEETDGTAQSQWRLLNTMPGYLDALKQQATAQGINVTSTDEAANKTALLKLAFGDATPKALDAADAYLEVADKSKALNDQLNELVDTINKANGVGQDAVSANADFQGALAGVSDEVQRQKDEFVQLQKDAYQKANGSLEGFTGTLDGFTLSLDENTAAGSENAASLADVAGKAQDAALAQYEVDKTTMGAKDATDKYIATLAKNRDAFIKTAEDAGYNADEVQKLADKVYALPSAKEVTILTNAADARSDLKKFLSDLNMIPGYREVIINEVIQQTGAPHGQVAAAYNANGSVMDFFAAGGFKENHVAQIAPAGSWRVWAEPETGGEAYIPLSPAKRARSLDIWQETGHRLGVAGFAQGGFMTGRDVQYVQPGRFQGVPSVSGGLSTVNNWNITEVSDPVAVAQAVQRRQSMLSV